MVLPVMHPQTTPTTQGSLCQHGDQQLAPQNKTIRVPVMFAAFQRGLDMPELRSGGVF